MRSRYSYSDGKLIRPSSFRSNCGAASLLRGGSFLFGGPWTLDNKTLHSCDTVTERPARTVHHSAHSDSFVLFTCGTWLALLWLFRPLKQHNINLLTCSVLKGFVIFLVKWSWLLVYLVYVVLEAGTSWSSACQARGGRFGRCEETCEASVQHVHAGGETAWCAGHESNPPGEV